MAQKYNVPERVPTPCRNGFAVFMTGSASTYCIHGPYHSSDLLQISLGEHAKASIICTSTSTVVDLIAVTILDDCRAPLYSNHMLHER